MTDKLIPERVVASLVYAAAEHEIDWASPFERQVSDAEAVAHKICLDHGVNDSHMTSPSQDRPEMEWMLRQMMARGPLHFEVRWCEHCASLYVVCPLCGNNSCNGGHGLNGKCPVCPIAYDVMYSIYRQGQAPPQPDDGRDFNRELTDEEAMRIAEAGDAQDGK